MISSKEFTIIKRYQCELRRRYKRRKTMSIEQFNLMLSEAWTAVIETELFGEIRSKEEMQAMLKD